LILHKISVLTARQKDINSEPKTEFCRATTRYLLIRLSHDNSINCVCEIIPCHSVMLRSNYNTCTHAQLVQSTLSLSLCFNGHLPGGPGLAGTRMSPFWSFLELRIMEVVVTTGAIRRAKIQSNCHHQQTNTHLFTGQMPFRLPN